VTRLGELARGWWQEIVAGLVFLVFAANFNAYAIYSDGDVAYEFLRRLFGQDVDAVAYQFGLALMNAPFYALGQLAERGGLSTIQDADIDLVSISAATNFYVVATLFVVGFVLRQLELRPRLLVLLLALFGSPLWYYGTFATSQSHASDTFLITSVVALLLLHLRRPDVRLVLAIGALLGVATTIRYFDATMVGGLVVALFLLGLRRDAVVIAAVSAATFGLLLLLPVALDVPLFARHYQPGLLEPSPASPFLMLFSNHRGLFFWTPVCLLGAIGYVLLLRHRPDQRRFLTAAGSLAAGLIVAQLAWPVWDAGWSFSQRYFTSFFPLVAIGLGGMLTLVRRPAVIAVAAAATAWSLFLGFNHAFGVDQSDGALEVAGKMIGGDRSVGEFLDLLWAYSRLRYAF
jgi:hypothetical protein